MVVYQYLSNYVFKYVLDDLLKRMDSTYDLMLLLIAPRLKYTNNQK